MKVMHKKYYVQTKKAESFEVFFSSVHVDKSILIVKLKALTPSDD